MYRIAIALTDPQRIAELVALLEPHLAQADAQIACATSPAEFLERLDGLGRIDVLFVDTVLDANDVDPTGIEFVASEYPAGSATQVIYVTNRLEHATAAYRTQHVYLLGGDFSADDLNDALGAACKALHAISARPLGVRVDGKMRAIVPSCVSYIESDRRRLHIHVGDEVLTTYSTLDAMARVLPHTFVRCHKSFLVNIRCIQSIDAAHVTLFTGEVLPVSQTRRKSTYEAFVAYTETCL